MCDDTYQTAGGRLARLARMVERMQWSGWMGVLALTVGLLGAARPAEAQTLDPVVFDGGVATPAIESGVASDAAVNLQHGAYFSLGASTRMTGARWWGVPFGAAADNFTVNIFAVNGGTAESTPLHQFIVGSAVNRTTYGLPEPYQQFQYEASLSATVLDPGDYLFSVVNASPERSMWIWAGQSNGAGASRANHEPQPWTASDEQPYFQLTGTADDPGEAPAVPEPSSVLLFLPALGVVTFVKRRRSA